MIRIAHIITRLTIGGAQETVFYYYNNYSTDKFEVFLAAGNEKDLFRDELLQKFTGDQRFSIIKNLVNSINPIKDLKAIYEVYKFLRKNRIQILQTHSSKAGFISRIAAKIARVPLVIHTVHGWSFHDRMGGLVKYIYIILEKFADNFTDKFIVVTKKDIEKGMKYRIGNKNKYVLIRSGIDFESFKNIDSIKVSNFKSKFNNKKIVGTIGRISKQKNYFDFVKIAKEIYSKNKLVHFVIIGDGELRRELEKQIKELNMEDNITILGIRTDINNILPAFDVFLLTSLWEGLPRVIPEAMHFKVPVIANAVDGVSEIIIDGFNGFLIEPNDIKASSEKVLYLLENLEIRNKFIENALNTIHPEYEASEMLKNMENLYLKIKF